MIHAGPRAWWPVLLLIPILATWQRATPARAFDGRTGNQIDIGAGQTIDDDLYVWGRNITIDGTVHGDVVAAGQIVTVNGSIDGNLVAAGQTVVVNGTVGGTARVAAQAFVIDGGGSIGRDVIFAGYSADVRPGSGVGRDLIAFGSQVIESGRVQRNLRGSVDALEVQGNVAGDVSVAIGSRDESGWSKLFGGSSPPGVTVPRAEPGLTVTDSAHIDGRLLYESTREFPISGRVEGGVKWTPRQAQVAPQRTPVDVAFDIGRKAVAIAAIGLLLLWLAPGGTQLMGDTIQARPGPSLGWGLVVGAGIVGAIIAVGFCILIFAIGLAAVTLGSLAVLVLLLGALGETALIVGLIAFAGFIAQAVVSDRAGRLVLRPVLKESGRRDVRPLFVGALIFAVLSAVPWLGGLIAIAAAAVALGAAWLIVQARRPGGPAARPRDGGPSLEPAPAA